MKFETVSGKLKKEEEEDEVGELLENGRCRIEIEVEAIRLELGQVRLIELKVCRRGIEP